MLGLPGTNVDPHVAAVVEDCLHLAGQGKVCLQVCRDTAVVLQDRAAKAVSDLNALRRKLRGVVGEYVCFLACL